MTKTDTSEVLQNDTITFGLLEILGLYLSLLSASLYKECRNEGMMVTNLCDCFVVERTSVQESPVHIKDDMGHLIGTYTTLLLLLRVNHILV